MLYWLVELDIQHLQRLKHKKYEYKGRDARKTGK